MEPENKDVESIVWMNEPVEDGRSHRHDTTGLSSVVSVFWENLFTGAVTQFCRLYLSYIFPLYCILVVTDVIQHIVLYRYLLAIDLYCLWLFLFFFLLIYVVGSSCLPGGWRICILFV